MNLSLSKPIWPRTRFNLTTPLHLILTGICVIIGMILYLQGIVYEGSMIAYMLAGTIFAYPYYSFRFTGLMTFLIMSCFLPISIWLQNKGVESASWSYGHDYILWITKEGQGPWGWTRHLWLGNNMPVMEYCFYPLFGLFHMTWYSVYCHVAPYAWFNVVQSRYNKLFLLVFVPMFVLFIAISFIYPDHKSVDYLYWLTGLGYLITLSAYRFSPTFERYSKTPAFWIWTIIVAWIFMPVWELFHSCINRDWVYNIENTFPAFYTYRDAGIPISEFFGYLTTATTFQALMIVFSEKLGSTVVKAERLLPWQDR